MPPIWPFNGDQKKREHEAEQNKAQREHEAAMERRRQEEATAERKAKEEEAKAKLEYEKKENEAQRKHEADMAQKGIEKVNAEIKAKEDEAKAQREHENKEKEAQRIHEAKLQEKRLEDAIKENNAKRKAELEALQLQKDTDLKKAQLQYDSEMERLKNETLQKEAELAHQKKMGEMENKKLNDIIANTKATHGQIIEQRKLAAKAEEKAMEEAERIAEDYRKEVERINGQRTQEHEQIKQRYEAKLKDIKEETNKDREEMKRTKEERIKFYKEAEAQATERYELEKKRLDELIDNRQLERGQMTAELRAEIARERENVEERYRSELDTLEKQKQEEREWYSEMKKQLTEEAEKIDAKHEKLMTQLDNDMDKAIEESNRLFLAHEQFIDEQINVAAKLNEIANQGDPNANFNDIIERNSEELRKVQNTSTEFHDKIDCAVLKDKHSVPDDSKLMDAEIVKYELKEQLDIALEKARNSYSQITYINIEENDLKRRAIEILGKSIDLYKKILEVVKGFEKEGPQNPQIGILKELEDELEKLSRDLPYAKNVNAIASNYALKEARKPITSISTNQDLAIDSANSTQSITLPKEETHE